MARSISYFIFSSNGSYLRWDDDPAIGFAIHQYQMSITGGSDVDRLYAGANTQVDATGLFASAGVDQLYLSGNFADYSGNFADYTQTVSSSGVYTFTGVAGGAHAGEVLSFSMTSSGDQLVFADRMGVVQLSTYLNIQTNSFAFIQSSQLTAGVQPNPASGAVPGNAASKVFVFDSGGINIPQLPIAGEAVAITGGSGVDSFYVRRGTHADATGLFASAGIDALYLTGKFADYTQTVSTGGVYTFTRHFMAPADVGLSEVVSFSLTSSGDKLVFADGGATLQLSHYLSGSSFAIILAADLDRTTVTPGVVGTPSLSLASDTGASASDSLTNNPTINVTGLALGTTWQYQVDGTAGAWQMGTGASFNASTGTHSYFVRQIDAAGNTSSVSTAVTYTLDTSAPATPILALASDTGTNHSDGLTNNATISVTGLESGATWQYQVDGSGAWVSATASGTSASFTASSGVHSYTVQQTDTAGNTSQVSTAVTYTLDTSAPATPILALASDTGTNHSDGLTSNPTIIVNGLEPSASWQYRVDTGVWQTGTGNSFTASSGAHSYFVQQTDVAGNTSPISTAIAYTLDTSASAPSLSLASDTGSSSADGITSNATIIVNGLEPSASWQYQVDASGWQTGTGNSFTASGGAHSYSVQQIDLAGNTSPISTSMSYNLNILAAGVNLAELGGVVAGFRLLGDVSDRDQSGYSVAGIGDINGDGYADFIIGAYGANSDAAHSNTGKSYVVFGKPTWNGVQSLNLSAIAAGSGGFVLVGEATEDSAGISVAGVGDLNGDGYADLIVGAYFAGGNAGKSYVVFGKSSWAGVQSLNLSTIAAGSGGFVLVGAATSDHAGTSVASAGDINGDGYADLIVGAENANGGTGKSYVVFGKSSWAGVQSLNLSAIAAGSGGFVLVGETNDYSGTSVASAGDINGDGYADLIVGAPGSDTGKSYVVFGKANWSGVQSLNLSAIAAGSGGFVLVGEAGDHAGTSVASAGDINGDGYADFIVGTKISGHPGKSYVVFGKSTWVGVQSLNLADIAAGSGGFLLVGETANDNAGISVAAAGDFNGDGYADLLVGAPGASTDPGKSYVVFGKSIWNGVPSLNLSAIAAGSGGFVLTGVSQGDISGTSVASAGDINGDGYADLLIGAPASATATQSQSYVLFGGPSYVQASGGVLVQGSGTVTGTSANEMIVGSSGSDTLSGGGGVDRFFGGAGNDVIILTTSDISNLVSTTATQGVLSSVDGGTGIDTLRLSGSANLDFTAIKNIAAGDPLIHSRIANIERIDLRTDSLANTLTLGISDVLDMAGMNSFNTGNGWTNATGSALGAANSTVQKHQLLIDGLGTGASADVVNLHGTWTRSKTGTNVGGNNFDTVTGTGGDGMMHTYSVYNSATGNAQLLIDVSLSIVPTLSLASDTGSSASDRITSNATINVGALEAGASWQYQVDASGWQTGTGNSFTATSGAHSYTVQQTDLAGNTSTSTATYTLDTSAPATPTLSLARDTGASHSDGITANPTIVVSGLEVGDTWQYQVDGAGAWVSTVANGTSATFTASGGAHSYVVRQTDAAGNTSTASSAFSYTVNILSAGVGFGEVGATVAGFALTGEVVGDHSGYSVAGVGDLNGDGYADLIVGAYGANSIAGKSYVVFGGADWSGTSTLNLSVISAGSGGFALVGEAGSDHSGYSVAGVGDLNGDGLADFMVGAKGVNNYAGKSYVVFGKASWSGTSTLNLSVISAGSGGFALVGEAANNQSGYSVAGVGDLNGDGYADFMVGAVGANSGAGKSYVVFGKADWSGTSTLNLSTIAAGTGGFALVGTAGSDYSASVAGVGDLNGDGYADFIIGAYADNNIAGKSYVVFGKASWSGTSTLNLSTIAAGSGGFALVGEAASNQSGYSVAGVGDLNGDGYADFMVGAKWVNGNTGKSYVVFGKADWSGTSTLNLSAIAAGTGGFALVGEAGSDYSGASVASAGDFNGDGYADLIIGAYGANNIAGKSYVVFGKASWSGVSTLNLSAIAAGSGGFVLAGENGNAGGLPGDQSGISVAAGDLNGDGYADLIIGANTANNGVGKSYVIFGGSSTVQASGGVLMQGSGTVTGTTANEMIVGSSGADTLTGGGGVDRFFGGAGNDIIILTSSDISNLVSTTATNGVLSSVDGGAGIDTLRLTGGASLDLTAIKNIAAGDPLVHSRIANIERIDLRTDTMANTLTLGISDVLDMAGINSFNTGNGWTNASGSVLSSTVQKHQLLIDGLGTGASADVVNLKGIWAVSQTGMNAGTGNFDTVTGTGRDGMMRTYYIYNSVTGNAQVLVDVSLSLVPTLSLASDTGSSASDRITSNATINVSGVEAGATWQYQVDTSAWITGTGASFTASTGAHSYTVQKTDLAGNASTSTATYTLDTSAPATPTLSLASDNGASHSDGVTANSTIVVSGLKTGATWQYQVDGAGVWISATASGTSASFTAMSGTHSYTLQQIDLAGNTSVVSTPGIYTYTLNILTTGVDFGEVGATVAGFALTGEVVGDQGGTSVASVGDLNGDGYADLIVGAKGANSNAGKSYVVFGKASWGGVSSLNLSAIAAGTGGFALAGEAVNDYSGYNVAGVGDINGDGYADFMVGAYGANRGLFAGKSYVVFGKADWSGVSSLNLSTIAAGNGGFALLGEAANNQSGISVAGVGDVNGDGYADFMVAAPGGSTGKSYVVFGKSSWSGVSSLNLSTIAAGSGGFALLGTAGSDYSNASVASVGDLNGDGYVDLIVGTYGFLDVNNRFVVGKSYVVFGKANWAGTSSLNLSAIVAGSGGFALVVGEVGSIALSRTSIAGVGDLNGDGYADFMIGVEWVNGNSGKSYVVFGKADWSGVSSLNLSDIAAGTGGFALVGEAGGDNSGYSVASAGDFNGDGYADLIVGAYGANQKAGKSYVVFGKASWSGVSTLNLSAIAAGSGGFVLAGENGNAGGLTGDQSGISVAAAGDLNGDGYADLIIGAYGANNSVGKSYVILGGSSYVQASGGVLVQSSNGAATGTSDNEMMVGSSRNDTLTGGGGVDRFFGGAGNDIIILTASDIANLTSTTDTSGVLSSVDGGMGVDTLRLTDGASLDLTAIKNTAVGNPLVRNRIANIERIDLRTDTMTNTLTLSVGDVLDMAGMNSFNTGNGWTNVGTETALGSRVQKHQLLIDGMGTGATPDVVLLQGAWTPSQTGANAGTSSIDTVTGTDSAGVTRTYAVYNSDTGNAQVLLDASIILTPSLSLASDTGASHSDGITSNATILLSGLVSGLVSGYTWAYQVDGTGDWATGTGSSFTATSGVHSYFVRQSDADGHTSPSTAAIYTLDTSAPTSPTLNLASDTGSSASDRITNSATVNVSGLEAGATWQYQVDTGAWTTGSGSSFTATSATHSYFVRQIDLAGNTSPVSTAVTYTLDTTAARAALTLSLASDTGASHSDGVTANPTILVQGLETDASWQYRVDTSAWQTGTGNSFTASSGLHSYSVQQTDLAGNTSNLFRTSYTFTPLAGVSLGDIAAGSGGFALTGEAAGDLSGRSVAGVGDLNGDDYADFMVSSNYANSYAGKSYVVFGKASWSGTSTLNLSVISAGSGGFALVGEYGGARTGAAVVSGDQSGVSVASAGDFNGDGYADLIVGAHGANSNAGKSYVVFGKANWSGTSTLNLSTISAGTGGFVLAGEAGGDNSGISVAPAGDLNGDGYTDFMVGASKANGGAGKSYVVFGKASWSGTSTLNLSTIAAGTGGFALVGEARGGNSGFSVAGVGDLNGDGYADLIIGAYGANGNTGKSYVVFGKANWSGVSTLNLSAIAAGTGGFALAGEAQFHLSGYRVASAGDINGDGYADLIVGAYGANSYAGKSYVVFGKANWSGVSTLNLSVISAGSGGFALAGEAQFDFSGASVASAGDFNGDGYADLIIGVKGADDNTGKSYVVFGKANWSGTSTLNLSTISAGTGGFALAGEAGGDNSGISVAAAGDLNGDGYADLIIGASSANSDAGKSYVILGGSSYVQASGGLLVQSSNGAATGTTANEMIVGSSGNDILTGGGGVDRFFGGAGNDIIILTASDIANLTSTTDTSGVLSSVDGGMGVDTLRLTGGASLDLTAIKNTAAGNPLVRSRIANIERIDLRTDASANTLTLSAGDVLDMARTNSVNTNYGWSNSSGDALSASVQKHQLIIYGTSGTDTINLLGTWMLSQTGMNVGVGGFDRIADSTQTETYYVYNSATSNAQVLIHTSIVIAPNLSLASDTGASSTDGIANNATILVYALQSGASWQYQVDGTGDWATGTGSSFTATSGAHSYSARLTSNTSLVSTVVTYTLDTSAPATPILALASDTGTNHSDGLTSNPTIIVNGLEPSASWQYRVDTGVWQTGTGNSFTASSGAHSYFVQQTDVAGNTSPISTAIAYTLDTSASAPSLSLASDTGASHSDGVTANPTILVQGLETDASWQYRVDTSSWQMGTGSSFIATSGTHSYSVQQTDLAGNTSNLLSTSYTFTPLAGVSLGDIAAGSGGFALTGEVAGDQSGVSVASVGDINGDGYADLIVGANNANSNAGKSYVVFGKASWSGMSTLNLSAIAAGTGGFTLAGEAASNQSGYNVAGVGDLNGDGYADFMVGAYGANSEAGKSYVVFGKASWSGTSTLNLSVISAGSGGFVLVGETASDQSGMSVAGIGDLNGDGYTDFMVGASKANGGAGKSYVVFGKTNWSGTSTLNLSTIAAGTGGFALAGEAINDQSSYSVAGVGDLNGDGYADLIVGAYVANTNAGKSYVVFGKANWSGVSTLNLSAIAAGTGGFALAGEARFDLSGYSVASAGDINGDGYADLIVGAYSANGYAGTSYVVFGKANWTGTSTLNLSTIAAGTGGFALAGEAINDQSSYSVAGVGDLNGDGYADLIVSAKWANGHAGKSYVVFGKASWSGMSTLNLSAIAAGSGGFMLAGEATNDQSGASVAAAGDLNGDGYADFIIGAFGANMSAGKSYVILGGSSYVQASGGVLMQGSGTVTGTTANEMIVGSKDIDTLTGGGGVDRFFGGAGNDIIILTASDIANLTSTTDTSGVLSSVDGGMGVDTLRLTGGASLDLTAIKNTAAGNPLVRSRIANIERIDLRTDVSANTLTLSAGDVLDMARINSFNTDDHWSNSTGDALSANVQKHQLIIYGTSGTDTINLLGTWMLSQTGMNVGIGGFDTVTDSTQTYTYYVYNSATSNAQVLIDTSIVIAPNLILTSDTGASSTDGITNNATILVYALQSGASWQYQVDGTGDWATGTGSSFIAMSGAHSYSVRPTSNTSLVSTVVTYTLDTSALAPSLSLASDIGASSSDRITSKPTINVSGLEAGATWQYRVDASAWQIGTGNSFTASSGLHSYSVQQIDLAGNTSPISTAVTYTLDTTAPAAPTLRLASDTGASHSDSVTANPTILVQGLETDASWQYRVDTSAWQTGTGNSFTATSGTHSYVVRQTDAAGNTSTASSAFSYTVNILSAGVGFGEVGATVAGFALTGEVVGDYSGTSVASVGDLNGDGYADLIVGAYGANSIAGKSYVVFGGADWSGTSTLNLSVISAGSGGFALVGEAGSDHSGYSVAGVGDLNGDGLADFMVGAKGVNNYAGKSYVVFGKASWSGTSTLNLSVISAGSGGFALVGEAANNRSGYSVAGVGDLNGDGYADFMVGAVGANSGAGKSYVVFGKADWSGTSTLNLSTIAAGTGGFALVGTAGSDYSASVAGVGDLNGDGYADFIIGAYADNNIAGKSYVVFGKASWSGTSTLNLSTIAAGSGGFALVGEAASNQSGYSVAGVGDLNGDGYADFMVGAKWVNGNTGKSYVVFGKADWSGTSTLNLSAIAAGTGGFALVGEAGSDYSGASVASAGDFNGDGYADLIIGAYGANNIAGKSYVVFGKASWSGVSTLNLSAIAAGSGGFVLAGENGNAGGLPGDQSGISVAAGDLNGDGYADLIIGANTANNGVGKSYVIFGGSSTVQASGGVLMQGSGTVTGTTANEMIVGSSGADTLTGGGGVDRFFGGAGNDIIILTSSDISNLVSTTATNGVLSSVDGGTGIDTLRLTGGASLDLTAIKNIAAGDPLNHSRIASIERINLRTDTMANTLTLSIVDVLDMAGINSFNTGNSWTNATGSALGSANTIVQKHQLVIDGLGSGATPDVVNLKGTWTQSKTGTNVSTSNFDTVTGTGADGASHTYYVYNSTTGNAQVLIDMSVTPVINS